MRKLASFFCFLALAVPALAVEGGRVMYVGGSAAGLVAGTLGNLDMTSETALIFESGKGRLEIPYAALQSFEYSSEVSHHLGVMPAIAVSLVKMRRHRHFFRISYTDQKNIAQVAVLEVPKEMPRTLSAVLQMRSSNHPPKPPCAKAQPAAPCQLSDTLAAQ